MKLTKVQENITRVYTGGEAKETVNNAVYEIRDDEGHRVGEMNAYNGGSYSVSISGATASIEEAVAEVKAMFNITE